jgi:hypothetical protein
VLLIFHPLSLIEKSVGDFWFKGIPVLCAVPVDFDWQLPDNIYCAAADHG